MYTELVTCIQRIWCVYRKHTHAHTRGFSLVLYWASTNKHQNLSWDSLREHIPQENTFYKRTHSIREHILNKYQSTPKSLLRHIRPYGTILNTYGTILTQYQSIPKSLLRHIRPYCETQWDKRIWCVSIVP